MSESAQGKQQRDCEVELQNVRQTGVCTLSYLLLLTFSLTHWCDHAAQVHAAAAQVHAAAAQMHAAAAQMHAAAAQNDTGSAGSGVTCGAAGAQVEAACQTDLSECR